MIKKSTISKVLTYEGDNGWKYELLKGKRVKEMKWIKPDEVEFYVNAGAKAKKIYRVLSKNPDGTIKSIMRTYDKVVFKIGDEIMYPHHHLRDTYPILYFTVRPDEILGDQIYVNSHKHFSLADWVHPRDKDEWYLKHKDNLSAM